MPVRYFRLVDERAEISPIHEQLGESWSWRTFLSYAGPGFLVASRIYNLFISYFLSFLIIIFLLFLLFILLLLLLFL